MDISKLELVLTQTELSRISITELSSKKTHITADVHGMKCFEAKRFINNIINLMPKSFQLNIIHGYNHGTAIKDMLAKNFSNPYIYEQHPDPYNQGVTCMFITA